MNNIETIIVTGNAKNSITSKVCLMFAALSLFCGLFSILHLGNAIFLCIFIGIGAILLFLSQELTKYQITVTNKRITGKCPFGKQVDLPLDSISAVAKCSSNTIAVSTSSGRIVFRGIVNYEQVFTEINKLLAERQNLHNMPTVVNQQIAQSTADELKKFKELYDSGVITQQEFEEKKRQLLKL